MQNMLRSSNRDDRLPIELSIKLSVTTVLLSLLLSNTTLAIELDSLLVRGLAMQTAVCERCEPTLPYNLQGCGEKSERVEAAAESVSFFLPATSRLARPLSIDRGMMYGRVRIKGIDSSLYASLSGFSMLHNLTKLISNRQGTEYRETAY